jgi:cell division septum initiation protein DivIVA
MSHLIPVSLANQAVAECEKVIAGLMDDNKRLKEQVKELEEKITEERKAYMYLYEKNDRLIKTYEAIKKLVP